MNNLFLASLGICFSFAVAVNTKSVDVINVVAAKLPSNGEEWNEMEKREAACRAAIIAIHKTPIQELELFAQTLTRYAEGNMTFLEQRAFAAISQSSNFSWTTFQQRVSEEEIQLWKITGTGEPIPMPLNRLFGTGLTEEGLGRIQERITIADYPDAWINHPNHPRNPANWPDWVKEMNSWTEEQMQEQIYQGDK